jgi:hypothetical protein
MRRPGRQSSSSSGAGSRMRPHPRRPVRCSVARDRSGRRARPLTFASVVDPSLGGQDFPANPPARIDEPHGLGRFASERTRPARQPEDALYLLVDPCLRDRSGANGLAELVAPELRRPGHLDIETAEAGCDRVVDGAPVGDDDTVEAPFRPQEVVEHRMRRQVCAVQLVVGAHDRPRVCLPDGELEGKEIDLAQRAPCRREPAGCATE